MEPMVKKFESIPAEVFGDEAPGVSIRVLVGEEDGAPVHVLRMLEIEPGGHTPDHEHPWEHENYVLSGKGQVTIAGEDYDVGPGYVLFVPPGVRHQYRCEGDRTFRFLCGIPVERFRQ